MRVPARWASLVVSAGVAASCSLTSCAGPVAVPLPSPSPTASAVVDACRELKRQLPSAVGNQVKRRTDPESDFVASWGDPPVTLRCGVPKPKALLPTSQLITIDNVDWFPEQRTNGYIFVTTSRVANVEVAVPDTFQPETEALVDLSKAITSADPLVPAAR